MLTQIFKSILLMSAVGSVLSIFLLCLAPITRKLFSPRWQYYIWLTVLVVMILPIHFSLPNKTANIPQITQIQSENIVTESKQTENPSDIFQPQKNFATLSIPKIPLPQNIFYHFAKIWILGMIAALFAKTAKYNLFLRAIHKNSNIETSITNIPKRLKVRSTDMLDAPLIAGLFKPTLFLPNTPLSENDMNYILMHELTHCKRGDIWYKWLAMLVQCAHWFNPFVYIVSRQIDTECEVSCDFAVTSQLSDSEKNNYMNMILNMLSRSKSNPRLLTTQMASGKKTLKRRFTMIRNKKSTNKFVSVISILTAVVLLSSSVFASGILSDFTTDDYTVEISSDLGKIDLTNKPFIENGEIYVPLRETLKNAMPSDEGITDVVWNDGTIDVIVAYYQGDSGMFQFKIDGKFVTLRRINYEDYKNNSIEKSSIVMSINLTDSPILKNSTTYLTLKDVNYMLYTYTNRRNNYNRIRELYYAVYDKSGNILYFPGHGISFVGQQYSIQLPNRWNNENYKSFLSEDGTTRHFVQKANYDKYGTGILFSISEVESSKADELLKTTGGSRLLYKNDNHAYLFIVPTDVQYPDWDEEIAKEYKEMYADIELIAGSFDYFRN